MRSGIKLKLLLSVCDLNLSMEEDGKIVIVTVNKSSYQSRRKEGTTYSAVLDKAYRQMLKDANAKFSDE